MFVHSHNIVLIIFIFLHQEFKQLCFLFCKFMVDLRVTVDFDRNVVSSLVIKTAYNLCKAAFPKDLQYFVSVKDLVSCLYDEVALLVIAFTFAFCFTTYCSFYNITWIVYYIITFKTIIIIIEFLLFKVSQNVRVILSELTFLHWSPCICG